IDTLASELGIESVPYFTENLFRDADLIERFLALHRAVEAGRDAFRERELLVGTFGRLFQRHGSGGGRLAAAPRGETPLRATCGPNTPTIFCYTTWRRHSGSPRSSSSDCSDVRPDSRPMPT